MSHADKLAQAIALIESHNAQLDNADDKISVAQFQTKLKKLGGTSEDTLRECSWEDLEECGLPRILARKIASLFRTAPTAEVPEAGFISDKKAQRMHPLYLVQNFDLNEPDSPVGKRLKEISKGKRFLAVRPDGTIDVDVSVRELQQLQKGYDERIRITVDNKPVELRPVGYRRPEMADENPIYKGFALRPGGVCDQTNRSWEQVSKIVRQLIRVAIYDTHEITVNGIDDAHDVLDRAIQADAESKLRQRYTEASVKLDEMIEAGTAPWLTVPIGGNKASNKNDPFFTTHKQF